MSNIYLVGFKVDQLFKCLVGQFQDRSVVRTCGWSVSTMVTDFISLHDSSEFKLSPFGEYRENGNCTSDQVTGWIFLNI